MKRNNETIVYTIEDDGTHLDRQDPMLKALRESATQSHAYDEPPAIGSMEQALYEGDPNKMGSSWVGPGGSWGEQVGLRENWSDGLPPEDVEAARRVVEDALNVFAKQRGYDSAEDLWHLDCGDQCSSVRSRPDVEAMPVSQSVENMDHDRKKKSSVKRVK